jgi:hypothetical protein
MITKISEIAAALNIIRSFINGSKALCYVLAAISILSSYIESVGLPGWAMSPSLGRYLHTEQHKHRINAHTDIHALDSAATVIGASIIHPSVYLSLYLSVSLSVYLSIYLYVYLSIYLSI